MRSTLTRRLLSTSVLRMHADRDRSGVKGVLSFAAQARAVLALRTSGYLTSVCESNPRPFTSVMPYAFNDANPTPLIALNGAEVHTSNVRAYPVVALQVFPLLPTHASPSACGMWNLQLRGPVYECAEQDVALATFLGKFPQARAHLLDPRLFVFVPEHVSLVGRMLEAPIPIATKDYYSAPVDAVARRSRALIERVNAHHVDDLVRLCTAYGELEPANIDTAFCFFVDSLGFDVMAVKRRPDAAGKYVSLRLPFETPRESVEDAAEAMFNAFVQQQES